MTRPPAWWIGVALATCACRWDFALANGAAGGDLDGPTTSGDGPAARIDSAPLDDAGRGDPDGLWVAERATPATDVERTRDDLVSGIRLELLVSPPPLAGDLRWITLAAGVIDSTGGYKLTTSVSGDVWVLDAAPDPVVQVLVATWLDADRVSLVHAPADPRNQGGVLFDRLTLRRTPPRDPRLVGDHQMTRYRYPGGLEQDAGGCEVIPNGSRRVDGQYLVSPRLLLDSLTLVTDHAGGDCAGAGVATQIEVAGWLEQTAEVLDAWLLYTSGERATTRWTVTQNSTRWRLARTSCHPATSPVCADLFELIELGPTSSAR